MHLKCLLSSVLLVCLLFATSARAQDNPMEDPDLQQLLKQAQEMQKNAHDLQKNPGSRDTRKKLADMGQ
jgi:nitrate reductase cytochrome c-type subunit